MPLLPLGLYIHWPFCLSKCPYCDFNSFVGQGIDVEAYTRAYMGELERFYKQTHDLSLTSIFFGGGTPSLMPPLLTAAIITKAKALWGESNLSEITLEANPSTAEMNRFQAFRDAGVNRLSIGIQSFQEQSLKFLGRGHNADEGKRAIAMAQNIFPRVSFDLIYALPEQTLTEWKEELTYALSLGTGHLSLYQLTIEPGTAFAPRYDRGEIVLPEEDLAADLYELTQTLCQEKGLPAYEISNHARRGDESQHNLIYWRYDDYIGIGPGAHGRFKNLDGQKIATEQHRAPDVWLKKVLEDNSGDIRTAVISEEDQAKEALMMALRLKEGIDLNRHPLPYGATLDPQRLKVLINEGDLIQQEQTLTVTEQGRPRLNGILRYLLG